MGWVQPPENTHASLVEAMNRFDGVEFDLRLTADNQLIVHHDHRISIPDEKLEGREKYVENWNLDELTEIGFCSFSKLVEDEKFSVPWREHSKVACLEIKRSHPTIAKNSDNKMAEIMRQAASIIDEAEIPETNAVFYAFHRGMAKVAKDSGSQRPWSTLLPIVPRVGSHNRKRIRAFPEFILYSFSRILRKQMAAGSPMMPCALDYFEGIQRFMHLGLPVGLRGAAKRRLQKIKGDYPVYIWPGHPHLERSLIEAGCSLLTDFGEPEVALPCGSLRWERPATMPLSEEQWKGLAKGIMPEDVTPWHELSENQPNLPWEAVRIIGHRGMGSTPRPMFP